MKKLIGPFKQILPLTGLPLKGALADEQLHILPNGGVLIEDGLILAVDDFDKLRSNYPLVQIEEITGDHVLLPGFIDCHTHICFAGSRAKDYAMRNSGKTYLEIAQSGGGIWDSVTQTRTADEVTLTNLLIKRVQRHVAEGVTTIEIKSGYGLSVDAELRQLQAIKSAGDKTNASLISTCLAAHILPKDFDGNHQEYLNYLLQNLLPVIKQKGLSNRVDVFIEQSAFNTSDALNYLAKAKQLGFEVAVHADQFTTGGSEVAIKARAASADHLEASGDYEIKLLANSDTVAVTLPGASLGLGMPYAPARKLLNAGACLAIASDWNPGSAPMGDLLMQAAVMAAAEKLSAAEVFAGLTSRAAQALKLDDRGSLSKGKLADMQAYPCDDYCEILYQQGKLKPEMVWTADLF
ncbi:imidazolonepropionase [Mucilaginibacter sp. FT3.2]|uniref:imidazolonepropionase n=1 Tax=Mucilaginibacter sp. FT3.2 TaxID=2723090 RepID=UPI0016198285|nr:imidazolonepropionase [Mucilaginibacter sp. FT3.2]MBB6233315.1 imidazolonepropionase [Mucilaginibacter sp. FT3.2]